MKVDDQLKMYLHQQKVARWYAANEAYGQAITALDDQINAQSIDGLWLALRQALVARVRLGLATRAVR